MNDKQRVRHNVQWLLSENIASMIFSFVASAIVARYLGPTQNGKINYCVAIFSLWTGMSNLGTSAVFQKEFLTDKFLHEELMGTGIVVGIIGGGAAAIGAVGTGILLRVDKTLLIYLGVIAIANLFKCIYIIQCFFLAQLLSRQYVKANVLLQAILLTLKVALIASQKSIIYFVSLYLVEGVLQFLFYMFLYYQEVGRKKWKFSLSVMKEVCAQGFPQILSSIAVTIYMRSDQIMLGKVMGDAELGIYSVAVTLSEIGQFIPVAIANSELTRLVKIYGEDKKIFKKEYIFFIEKMVILTLVMVIGIELFAKMGIYIVYGEKYAGAVSIMRLYAISEIFVAIGMAEGPYININRIQKQHMYITCIAGGINIILNYILISKFGGKGAAIATIIAMAFQTIFLLHFFGSFKEMLSYIYQAFKFKETRNKLKELRNVS